MSRSTRPNLPKGRSLLQPPSLEPGRSSSTSRSGKPLSSRRRQGAVLVLILSFLVLQFVTLSAALMIVMSEPSSRSETAGRIVSADASLVEKIEPVRGFSPTPHPSPTDRPREINISSVSTEAPTPTPTLTPIPTATPTSLPPSAVRFRGVELTQGIQVLQEPENPRCHPNPDHPHHIFCNNSMPMVADRHTMLRVYLACNDSCPNSDALVRLRILKDGQVQDTLSSQFSVQTLQNISSLTLYDLRADLGRSVNFSFTPPPAWMEGDITFEVETSAQADFEKAPATWRLTKQFVRREPLRVAYLPIAYNGVLPPDPQNADYWLLRMYPVPAVEYYRLPMPDLVWDGDLSKGEVLRKLLYTYWLYAQYRSNQTHPDQLFGWLPKEFYNGGASDPFWCPNCAGPHSSRVAFGGLRPEQDIGGPRILAHEIAHNLGAQHAWSPTSSEDAGCFKAEGADIRVDPNWPYSTTPHIQEFGIDLYSDPPVIHPPYVYDVMAYCTQPWISPHTYRTIFNSPFLKTDHTTAEMLASYKPQVQDSGNGTLMISGVVYPDGTVSRPEIIRLESDAFVDAAGFMPPQRGGGSFCVEVWGKYNKRLAEHCFNPGFIDLETGLPTDAGAFFFPVVGIDPADVVEITLSNQTEELVTLAPSNHAPEVSIISPGNETVSGDRLIVVWDAYDADGDALVFDLLYSADGGQSWQPLVIQSSDNRYTLDLEQVPSSNQALIRVVASDGFHTTSATTTASLAAAQPENRQPVQPPPAKNSITLQGPALVEAGRIFEVEVVAHQISEPGIFGFQATLGFDPALLQVRDIQPHPDFAVVAEESIRNDIGRMTLIASRQGEAPNLAGQMTLATISLTAIHPDRQMKIDLLDFLAGVRDGSPLPLSETQRLSIQTVPQ